MGGGVPPVAVVPSKWMQKWTIDGACLLHHLAPFSPPANIATPHRPWVPSWATVTISVTSVQQVTPGCRMCLGSRGPHLQLDVCVHLWLRACNHQAVGWGCQEPDSANVPTRECRDMLTDEAICCFGLLSSRFVVVQH